MNKKFLCTSDIHGKLANIASLFPYEHFDFLLIAGDICPDFAEDQNINVPMQSKWLCDQFVPWIESIDIPNKIVIGGNHDFVLEAVGKKEITNLFDSVDVHYLEHSAKEIDGINFFGSPWTPWFWDWAYNLPKLDSISGYSEAYKYWNQIPENTEVLLTHGPPHGLLDVSSDNCACGCPMLRQRLYQLSKLKLHIFGHIHDPRGGTITLDTESSPIIANVAYGYHFEKNKTMYSFDIDF